eukprot:TRINITY_DN1630_c0_g1_i1.p1 TRINITY_DN1630_c0_g1~~TRINITY_DN1630_c0_g1_i1.p1  ORF type:complete len:1015 (-),score=391.00 TRINITY_DN1630_c0_g1_i1:45-3089(-)
MEKMDIDEGNNNNIDEDLYSRQLYALGHKSMKRIMESDVLIVGLRGLGVEIAKNIVLTGVRSVSLHDDNEVEIRDLGSQFYLSEDNIGQPRAESCIKQIKELNNHVNVKLHTGELTEDYLKEFTVVVVTEELFTEQQRINDICHRNNVSFISGNVEGVFGGLFCDFCDYVTEESNDEPLKTFMIAAITQEEKALVSVTEDQRFSLEDGSTVVLSGMKGMEELQDTPFKVHVTDHTGFKIDVDTREFQPYVKGGHVNEVRQPVKIQFKPLSECLKEQPEVAITDFAKMLTPPQIHLCYLTLDKYVNTHQQKPNSHSEEDEKTFIQLAGTINEELKIVDNIDEKVFKAFANTCRGYLQPIAAFLGGIIAQEAVVACSSKYTPIKQFLYFDCVEVLPENCENFQPQNSRYDDQIVIFGKEFQEQILNLNYFLVGSGAIGCEMLKNWAMMGVAAGDEGQIYVTDMDTIERSNLNRQFLFRPEDIESLKSEAASKSIAKMNPATKIIPYSHRVGKETENIFNDVFYESLHGVCNALDNVEARMYMDTQCITYRLPLLESGTLGTRGNTQVIVPDLTESYASTRDPPEKTIPMCTLHHFPNKIEHTIQWARDHFEGIFKNNCDNANAFITQSSFIKSLKGQSLVTKLEIVRSIHDLLVENKTDTFEACVKWARLQFETLFNHNIKQLLYNFPEDMVTSSGAPFWSAPKTAPKPINFDSSNELHIDFIIAAANLRAFIFGISQCRDSQKIAQITDTIEVPEFVAKKVFIPENDQQANQNNNNDNNNDDSDNDSKNYKKIRKAINKAKPSPEFKLNSVEFEKDDPNNFHIDFITACSNLRASNYTIELADKHKTKGIAGKIIPALVTTTSMVAGCVSIELLKVIQKKPVESYKNLWANLALPFITFTEPSAPEKTKVTDDWSWTLWDRFDINTPMTMNELIDYFEDEYQLELSMMSCGHSLMYACFNPKAEIMDLELSKAFEVVCKKTLSPDVNYIALTVMCASLETNEDVDVPWVRYKIPK